MSSYKNLDYVVAMVQNDIQDYSTANYQRYLQFAINGYKKLNYSILPVIKVGYFNLSDIYTIDFPCDYVDYTLIGLVSGGQVITLSLNPNIPLSRKVDSCGDTIVEAVSTVGLATDLVSAGYLVAPHFRGEQYVGEQFATGGGFNSKGYFREDHEMRRFQFQNVVPDMEVLIEYKSTGIDDMGNAVVPDNATEALVAFVHMERANFDKRASGYDKQNSVERFRKAFAVLKKQTLKFTMSEYLDSKYKTVHMGIKR